MATAATVARRTPALFICHGGGPMPLLGKQDNLCEGWRRHREELFPKGTPLPSAILLVSAHYEEKTMKVGSGKQPRMMYDYGGFPPECYQYKYPAPGAPDLAAKAVQLLKGAGITAASEEGRDYDHGVFVPLMVMFPEATIPVVPISVLLSQDVKEHLAVGAALSPLRDEGVFILGSGSSSHNRLALGRSEAGKKFNEKLAAVLTDTESSLTGAVVPELARFLEWEGAEDCQVKGLADHLMPLFTVAGSSKWFQPPQKKKTSEGEDAAESVVLPQQGQQRQGQTPPIVTWHQMSGISVTEFTFLD